MRYCRHDETVLANEQVKAGRCWRCNGPVRQKDMSQWFIDITKYAQQLLDGLDTIEFPESVRLMQEDWLGRSEGAEIEFQTVVGGEHGGWFAIYSDSEIMQWMLSHTRGE